MSQGLNAGLDRSKDNAQDCSLGSSYAWRNCVDRNWYVPLVAHNFGRLIDIDDGLDPYLVSNEQSELLGLTLEVWIQRRNGVPCGSHVTRCKVSADEGKVDRACCSLIHDCEVQRRDPWRLYCLGSRVDYRHDCPPLLMPSDWGGHLLVRCVSCFLVIVEWVDRLPSLYHVILVCGWWEG